MRSSQRHQAAKPSNSREEGRNWEGIDPLRCCQHLIHYENTQQEIPTHTAASIELNEKIQNYSLTHKI